MPYLSFALVFMMGVTLAFVLVAGVLAWRSRERALHVWTGLTALFFFGYIFCTFLLYHCVSAECVRGISRIQPIFTLGFASFLILGITEFGRFRPRWLVWTFVGFAFSQALIRGLHPTSLLFSSIEDPQTVVLVWGEKISMVVATTTWYAWIYLVFIPLAFHAFIGAVVWQLYRRGERASAIFLCVLLVTYLTACVHDALAMQYAWRAGYWIEFSSGILVLALVFLALRESFSSQQLSKELEEARAMTKLVFDNSFQLAGVLDPQGCLIAVNSAALQMISVPEEKLLGKLFWETPWWNHDSVVQQQCRQACLRALQGEFVRSQTVHRDAQGKLHNVDFSIRPIFNADGSIKFLIPEGRDVTETLRVQERLALSIAAAGQGTWIYDISKEIIEGDTVFRSFVEVGENQDLSAAFAAAIGTQGVESLRDAINEASQQGGVLERKFTLNLPSGKERILYFRGHLQQNQRQTCEGVAWDASREEYISRRLSAHEHMQSLGQLAASVAHDCNNHLGVIQGGIELLSMEQNIASKQQSLLAMVQKAIDTSSHLLRGMLSFARGTSENQKTTLDVVSMVRDMEILLRRLLGRQITVEMDLPSEPLNIQGVSSHLENALMNLCVNARDAMSNGGSIRIGVHQCVGDGQGSLFDKTPMLGAWVSIKVEDSGGGIPSEIQEKIFEPFFTTKSEGHGTGLGLPSVLTCMRGHQGRLRLHSTPGKGTSITLYLPSAPHET